MMKSTIHILLAFVLILGLTGISCEGPSGPDGATGAQGPQGEQGAQGEQGPQGEDGNANIMYSEWIHINWNRDNHADFKTMYIPESRVMGDFIDDGGLVLMYLKVESPEGKAVTALPYLAGTDFLYFAIADIPAQNVQGLIVALVSTDTSGSTPVQTNWANNYVRYFLIPDGNPLAGKITSETDLLDLDYDTITRLLHINN